MYRRFIKPLCDRVAALFLLLLLSPLLVLVAILIWVATKGSPFFLQTRPGLHNELFTIYKFKTMTDERDADGNLLPDDDRLTWIGNIVRLTSVDELPQLLNVVKGDMSFIGPRPLLVRYLPLYSDAQRRRHLVTPGISGWAQVNGRNVISWTRKLELDVTQSFEDVLSGVKAKSLLLRHLAICQVFGITRKGGFFLSSSARKMDIMNSDARGFRMLEN